MVYKRNAKRGRPVWEPPVGAPRRGYDRRHDIPVVDADAMRREAEAASIMFSEAMKGRQ